MSHNNFDTSDFYSYEHLLTDGERDLLLAVRKFMATDVAAVLLEHWSRATFPFEIVPGMRELGLAGLPYHGYGCGGRRYLLDGMVAMELARTDCSVATFNGCMADCPWGRSTCADPTSSANDSCPPWRATTRSARSG